MHASLRGVPGNRLGDVPVAQRFEGLALARVVLASVLPEVVDGGGVTRYERGQRPSRADGRQLRRWYAEGGPSPSVSAIGGPAGLRSFPAADELIEVALRHGVSLVVEKAWQRRFDEARFRRFLPMANVVQIHVTVNEQVARRRWAERPGAAMGEHIERSFSSGEFTWADFAPLELGVPLYVADTTDQVPVDLARLESFIMKASPPCWLTRQRDDFGARSPAKTSKAVDAMMSDPEGYGMLITCDIHSKSYRCVVRRDHSPTRSSEGSAPRRDSC